MLRKLLSGGCSKLDIKYIFFPFSEFDLTQNFVWGGASPLTAVATLSGAPNSPNAPALPNAPASANTDEAERQKKEDQVSIP
jgi:hypothetical protein